MLCVKTINPYFKSSYTIYILSHHCLSYTFSPTQACTYFKTINTCLSQKCSFPLGEFSILIILAYSRYNREVVRGTVQATCSLPVSPDPRGVLNSRCGYMYPPRLHHLLNSDIQHFSSSFVCWNWRKGYLNGKLCTALCRFELVCCSSSLGTSRRFLFYCRLRRH
jgi:hypothetical protein